jgi:hypothetical protein
MCHSCLPSGLRIPHRSARRDLLQAGSLSLVSGLTLPRLLQARQMMTARGEVEGRFKSRRPDSEIVKPFDLSVGGLFSWDF